MIRRTYRLDEASAEYRASVGAALPSLMLLLAHASTEHGSRNWSQYWSHDPDPLWRIGFNWPKDPKAASLGMDLDHIGLYRELLSLGLMVLEDLTDQRRNEVAAIYEGRGPFEMICPPLREGGSPITSITPQLPESYAFAFLGYGTLVFQEDPARLLGIEVEIAPE